MIEDEDLTGSAAAAGFDGDDDSADFFAAAALPLAGFLACETFHIPITMKQIHEQLKPDRTR